MSPRLISTTLLCAFALQAHAAEPTCDTVETTDQRRDEDTIRRIERGWLAAEFKGNTRFLDCLLTPGYSVIVAKDNAVRSKADLLARVAKNSGKDPEIPPLEITVVINGDFATAFSVMKGKKVSGEPYEARYVDSYFFRDGTWHASAGVDL